MYYKIINKDSDVYKQLYDLRTKEQEIEKSNKKMVKELIGQDFTHFIGEAGQQNFERVTQFSGFEFKHPEKPLPKVLFYIIMEQEFAAYKGVEPKDENGKGGRIGYLLKIKEELL